MTDLSGPVSRGLEAFAVFETTPGDESWVRERFRTPPVTSFKVADHPATVEKVYFHDDELPVLRARTELRPYQRAMIESLIQDAPMTFGIDFGTDHLPDCAPTYRRLLHAQAEQRVVELIAANVAADVEPALTRGAPAASTSPLVPLPAPAPTLSMFEALLADLSDVYEYRGPQMTGETIMRKVRDDFDVQIGGMFRDAVTTGTGALMVKAVPA